MNKVLTTKPVANVLQFVEKLKKADLAAPAAVVFACVAALAACEIANGCPGL